MPYIIGKIGVGRQVVLWVMGGERLLEDELAVVLGEESNKLMLASVVLSSYDQEYLLTHL